MNMFFLLLISPVQILILWILPVSNLFLLSSTSALREAYQLPQLSKSLSFLKKSDMFAHFTVNSATLSAWNNNRSVDPFVGEVTFV